MKKIKYIFTFALLALLFAACSEDDIIQAPQTPSTGETEGTETVTFTATVDYSIEEDGSRTRAIPASEDEPPTRFYAQAVDETDGSEGVLSRVEPGKQADDGETVVFTITGLNPNHTYTYMFWADNANVANPQIANPDDLRNIPYSAGDIAFAAKAEGTPTSVKKTVDMKHAVAKVTLRTTKAVATTYGTEISLAASCASLYNVQDPASSTFPDTEASKTMTMGNSGLTANSEVLSTYIIPNPNNQTVTIGAHTMTMTLDNIPLEANTHVTLQGDLSTDNSKWKNAPAALVEETFKSYFLNEDGTQKGHYSTGNYYFSGTADNLQNLLRYITRNPDFTLSGSNQFIIGSSYADNLYIYAARTFDGSGYICYHNGSTTYDWIIKNGSYPALPTPPEE